jgi:hypothetical protein
MPRALFLSASLLLLCTTAGAAGESGSGMELKLASGTFRPLQAAAPPPDWYGAERVDSSASGRRYLVAITAGGLDLEQRRRLESLGAKLLDYIPANGYRLSVPPEAEQDLRALDFVEWLGLLPSHLKVAPWLSTAAGETVEAVDIRVVLNGGEPAERVMEVLAGMHANPRPSGKDGAWRVEVTIPADRVATILSRLAVLPEVEAVEPVLPVRTFNQDAVWVHQSFVGPSLQETPVYDHGIFGCDQIVAVADTGQDYDACYFRDDPNGPPPFYTCLVAPCPAGTPDLDQRKDIIYYNWSDTPTGDDDTCPATIGGSGHGTHTSGSIAGDAPDFADCDAYLTAARDGGDGQAPGARLVIQELGDGLEYLNNGGGTIWNMADVAYRSGARIHSISWGGVCHDLFGSCVDGCSLPYDSLARDADLAMWTYPDLLLVNAAGNAGQFCASPNSINTPGTAKSPLTVGAVGHGANAGTPSSFTSLGPVFDGRLKPTIAAQGEATVSAASDAITTTNNCGTCSLDGSSMSAPITSGLAALVREYYTAGYSTTGERNASAGFTPTGALIKATIIDGGVPLGTAAPGPDFASGFGRVLLGETLAFSGDSFQLRIDDHREGLTTGSVVTHAYDVALGTSLRATLVWTDYPAALNAAVARVNELMLEVIDPNGDLWFQTIDATSGAPRQTSLPADPHDSLNVEERLVFDTPTPGRWVVRVRGIDVPWGTQPFALVLRGALSDCAAPGAPASPTLTSPADDRVLVSWESVSGASAYNVYRSYGSCPAGPWVPVATAVAGTSFTDSSVVGGATYSYYVAAASDAEAHCESTPSPCETIVPQGDCTLAPDFHGIRAAASSGDDRCSIVLSWDAANSYCSADIRYNIYRSTSPGFIPGPANRVARCIVRNSWADAADLSYGTTFHYIVRAEDASPGHGGPCFDGNEETNLIELSASPDGPPVLGNWNDDAGDSGEVKFTAGPGWAVDATGGTPGGPNVYVGTSAAGICADLTTPVLTLADPGEGPALTFMTVHDLDYDSNGIFGREGSVGQVEIAQGPYFSPWTRVELSPDYPYIVDFPLNNCESTAAVDSYFTDTDLVYSTYSASLVNWGGQDVKIRFHISGDLIYTNGNWWIDDVEVTQAMVPGACTSQSVGPPPIPDGASVPGLPMMVEKSGADLALIWDASRCPATAVNVYHGLIGDYTTFTGGECGLPANGEAIVSMSDNSWFVIAATDGASTDGSWSRDGLGNELRYDGASAACPSISVHVDNNACP